MAKKDLKVFLKDNKFTVSSEVISKYNIYLHNYVKNINFAIQQNESEEHLKGILVKFLKDSLYFENKYSINTSSSVDAAISKDNKLQVLIETKKPQNAIEMITEANLNKKALWEIILYYIHSTRTIQDGKVKRNPDSEIKNLVITDCKNFFIFDSQKIESLVKGEIEKFWEKKETSQLISSNKDIFYDKAKDFFAIEENISRLDYVYFNIEELSKTQAGAVMSFKMLSRHILLKDTSNKTVAAPLNSDFYKELLYILGLKEVEEQGKTLIKINFDVENTFAVQVYKYLKEDKGILDENEVIDKTFSAIIVWTNRLLFIKLFEGQLFAINGEKQEYRILDKDKIKSENDLQSLFFKVLGTKDREVGDFFDKFKDVPYLNSSLFENYSIEKSDIMMRDIENAEVVVKPRSKTKKQGKLKLVEYVIDFLNSYNFSSVLVGEGETTNGKEIIDAAVLGLIFEKINGYKDGSYYTPSTITEYICKETIESAVVQKVNEYYNQELKNFDELVYFVSNLNLEKKKQINEIINRLKICDPAVGSGHFLVSALNRIIAVKSELGVLFYHNENKLLSDFEIRVVNDILTVTDGNGELFSYNRASAGSFKVQKTIFCEKRQIIENCLFGVDINDKAVSICQLRLWIELLKNAYYENNVMETLPNIDINIKCGNSLVHKLPVEVGKKLSVKADKDLRKLIYEYKQRVNNYKQESNKINKQQIKNAISNIKGILHQSAVQTSMDFIEDAVDYEEIELMKNAFEWAVEFPEVLSDDGTFLGFDCVIGNPPYIDSEAMTEKMPKERRWLSKNYNLAKGNWDIYIVFFELSLSLINKNGLMSFITPDKWIAKPFGIALRKFIIDGLVSVLKAGRKVFREAKVDSIISVVSKSKSQSLKVLNVEQEKIEILSENFDKEMLNQNFQLDIVFSKNISLIKKIESDTIPLNSLNAKCEGACITSDFYVLSEIIEDDINLANNDDYFKIINTGIIDKYDDLWGKKPMKYDGKKIMFPVVKKQTFISKFSKTYVERVNSKKIIIKGMTLLDACLDNFAKVVPAKSTLVVMSESERTLKLLLAFINSDIMAFYIKEKYSSFSYNGGITFTKDMINSLPIKKITKDKEEEIISYVEYLLNNKNSEDLEKLNNCIYNLYGLSKEEIAVVEESLK